MKKNDPQESYSRKSVAVSSGNRGAPFAELIESIEKETPHAVKEAGLSSAALRAADKIREMRREAGLSQTDLARAINVKPSRVSELEAGIGKLGPSWDLMERIAHACGKRMVLIAA